MTENKSPSYPWYPRDFAGDEPVQLMSLEEEAAYRRLLDHQWLHGSIPSDPALLARICKNIPVARMQKLWLAIAPCFIADEGDPGRLYNRKLERVREERETYRRQQSESGRLGAEARWGKGRPPRGGPTSGAIGAAIGSVEAGAWPASADASSSAIDQPSGRAHEGDPPVQEGTQVARLIFRMRRASDRWAVWNLIDRIPDREQPGWIGQLNGYLDGMDLPAGMQPSPEQLATACRDYACQPGVKPSPLHFRAFVRRVLRERHARAQDGPAGPRRGTAATGPAALEAGRSWAERKQAEAGQ